MIHKNKLSLGYLEFVLIGIGAALGGIFRVALGKLLVSQVYGIALPIMAVNILGCFIMGVVTASLNIIPEGLRIFLIPGLLGGFTTFSSFALEFGLLCEKNLYFSAFLYASLSVLLSFICFFVGLKLTRLFL